MALPVHERERSTEKYSESGSSRRRRRACRFSAQHPAGSSSSTPTTNGDLLRRGAATDLMEQVGDALAAPRVALMLGEKAMWWSPEKGVRTKKMQVSLVRGAKQDAPKCGFPRRPCPGSPTSGGVVFGGSHTLEQNVKHARGRRDGVENPG